MIVMNITFCTCGSIMSHHYAVKPSIAAELLYYAMIHMYVMSKIVYSSIVLLLTY